MRGLLINTAACDAADPTGLILEGVLSEDLAPGRGCDQLGRMITCPSSSSSRNTNQYER